MHRVCKRGIRLHFSGAARGHTTKRKKQLFVVQVRVFFRFLYVKARVGDRTVFVVGNRRITGRAVFVVEIRHRLVVFYVALIQAGRSCLRGGMAVNRLGGRNRFQHIRARIERRNGRNRIGERFGKRLSAKAVRDVDREVGGEGVHVYGLIVYRHHVHLLQVGRIYAVGIIYGVAVVGVAAAVRDAVSKRFVYFRLSRRVACALYEIILKGNFRVAGARIARTGCQKHSAQNRCHCQNNFTFHIYYP